MTQPVSSKDKALIKEVFNVWKCVGLCFCCWSPSLNFRGHGRLEEVRKLDDVLLPLGGRWQFWPPKLVWSAEHCAFLFPIQVSFDHDWYLGISSNWSLLLERNVIFDAQTFCGLTFQASIWFVGVWYSRIGRVIIANEFRRWFYPTCTAFGDQIAQRLLQYIQQEYHRGRKFFSLL